MICCTRNREKFVRQHFKAVWSLLPERAELIYALDHCSDGTRSFLEEAAAGDSRVKIIENSAPPGLFSCRNFALDHATGKYIHYLDDDDSVSADFYELLDQLVTADDEADLIVTDLVVNVEGQPTKTQQILNRSRLSSKVRGTHEWIEGDLFEAVLKGYLYFNSANALIHRRVFARQRFSAEIKKTADWLFYLEHALNGPLKALYVSGISAIYYVHPSSMSIAGDKSYWNMRIFERLHSVVPSNHPMRDEVERVYGRSLFDAGYAERGKNRRQAAAYYWKAAQRGLFWPAFKASLKLLIPR